MPAQPPILRVAAAARNFVVFIDGAYLEYLFRQQAISVKIDFSKFWFELQRAIERRLHIRLQPLRINYYNALPFLGRDPTPEAEAAYNRKLAFFAMLEGLPLIKVRKGNTAMRPGPDGHPVYVQKQVDLLLGLDMALLAAEGRVSHVIMVTGDADMIPAVDVAQAKGVQVWLAHGPRGTYSDELYGTADGRISMDETFQRRVALVHPVCPVATPVADGRSKLAYAC